MYKKNLLAKEKCLFWIDLEIEMFWTSALCHTKSHWGVSQQWHGPDPPYLDPPPRKKEKCVKGDEAPKAAAMAPPTEAEDSPAAEAEPAAAVGDAAVKAGEAGGEAAAAPPPEEVRHPESDPPPRLHMSQCLPQTSMAG